MATADHRASRVAPVAQKRGRVRHWGAPAAAAAASSARARPHVCQRVQRKRATHTATATTAAGASRRSARGTRGASVRTHCTACACAQLQRFYSVCAVDCAAAMEPAEGAAAGGLVLKREIFGRRFFDGREDVRTTCLTFQRSYHVSAAHLRAAGAPGGVFLAQVAGGGGASWFLLLCNRLRCLRTLLRLPAAADAPDPPIPPPVGGCLRRRALRRG